MLGPCSKKQELILSSVAELLICGGAAGSGKSYLLLLMMLQYVDCPFWRGVIFRRTTTEIESGGGLFDEAVGLYGSLPEQHRPKINVQKLTFTFPSGAVLKLSHLQHHPRDTIKQHGAQWSLIAFDELTTFEEEQFIYMSSRLRSKSKYPGRIVCTCNPDCDSFVLKYVQPYLDEEGLPRPEMDGKKKYIIRRGDELNWADTKEEHFSKFGKDCKPIHYEFISATIRDNPILISMRPEYLAHLESLRDIDKARLLDGNWYARPQGANYFRREDLIKVDRVPNGAVCARGWDKASTEPHDNNKYPDFTATGKMYKDRDGFFYIVGDHCNSNHENDSEVYGKFRKKPGPRDNIILDQAVYDGAECTVVLPIDAGQAGKIEFIESAKKLSAEGFIVKKDPAVNGTSKLIKFTPFSVAVENGLVHIVPTSFRNKDTMDDHLNELEKFDNEKSTKTKKDDIPDAYATVFNYLNQSQVVPIVIHNQIKAPTAYNNLKNRT